MTSIWSQIRAGSWITLDRLRGYAIMLVAGYAIATVVWIALSHGLIDPNNKPLGTDFSNVYAAGTLAINGKAGTAYDWPSQYAAEKALFDGRDGFGAGTREHPLQIGDIIRCVIFHQGGGFDRSKQLGFDLAWVEQGPMDVIHGPALLVHGCNRDHAAPNSLKRLVPDTVASAKRSAGTRA